MAAHYTKQLNVPSPKGRDMLSRIQCEFGGNESLLSAETPPNPPPVPMREDIRVRIALIQTKITLCAVTLYFSRGINLFFCTMDCLGAGVFCLELDFCSPGVYIHTSHPVLLCCCSPGQPELCPCACRDTALRPQRGNCSLVSLGSCVEPQSPSPFLTFAWGWCSRPDPDSSGQDSGLLGKC